MNAYKITWVERDNPQTAAAMLGRDEILRGDNAEECVRDALYAADGEVDLDRYMPVADMIGPVGGWVAVDGFGRAGAEVGVLGEFNSREEAEACVRQALEKYGDNPAYGAWVRQAN